MSRMENAMRGERTLLRGNGDWRQHQVVFGIVLLLGLLLPLTACGSGIQATSTGGAKVLNVVAGENFWGSLAMQLGGKHASVKSLVSSPSGDPHDYESTNDDARAMAQADYVILNGAGYDAWGTKLIDANPAESRKLLDVGKLVGKKEGENPHLWYHPTYVQQAAKQITADYQALDPVDSVYFEQQYHAFEAALQPYLDKIAEIKAHYAGTPIGISESIFVYMADALGLNIITPEAYYNAEASGSEPPASAVAQFHDQISRKAIQVFILNVQTVDNSVKNLRQQVAQAHIPVVEVSETVRPPNGVFQDWQLVQLNQLEQALSQHLAS
ncbi:MAG: zinc ABC transporter substrate-binding protein [Ktedonobacteraceae bacterium]|nr:zinc ABC transporter substrate-binding protein [Ktedonobacteraceae bacterium]